MLEARGANDAGGAGGGDALERASRVEGDAIVFAFEGAEHAGVEALERGIVNALENALTGSVTITDARGARVKTALGREFWAKRWIEGQIGFHEGKPNDLLAAHVKRLESASGKDKLRIVVPLSGKAFDLRWLAERGHEIVGIEVVWEAVQAFFAEWNASPPVASGKHRSLTAKGVTLVCADVFEAAPAELGRFDALYDRAALVALEPSTRERYVATCRSLLGDGGKIFLVAFSYDQALAPGPPWSIDEATVRKLYAGLPIEILERRSLPASKRLADSGITALEETAYLIG